MPLGLCFYPFCVSICDHATAACLSALPRCDRPFLVSLSSSAKVCERVGMRQEATLRESHYQLGEWRDELVYAVLVSERRAD